jgi:hypothetical protein
MLILDAAMMMMMMMMMMVMGRWLYGAMLTVVSTTL